VEAKPASRKVGHGEVGEVRLLIERRAGRAGDAEKGQLEAEAASIGGLQIAGEVPPFVGEIRVGEVVGGKRPVVAGDGNQECLAQRRKGSANDAEDTSCAKHENATAHQVDSRDAGAAWDWAARAGSQPASKVATHTAAEAAARKVQGKWNWMLQPKDCTLITRARMTASTRPMPQPMASASVATTPASASSRRRICRRVAPRKRSTANSGARSSTTASSVFPTPRMATSKVMI